MEFFASQKYDFRSFYEISSATFDIVGLANFSLTPFPSLRIGSLVFASAIYVMIWNLDVSVCVLFSTWQYPKRFGKWKRIIVIFNLLNEWKKSEQKIRKLFRFAKVHTHNAHRQFRKMLAKKEQTG